MPGNLETLITQHLIRVVPRVEFLLFNRQRFINERGKSHGHVLNSLKGVLRSIIVFSPDNFSLAPSTSSAIETSENTEKDPDDTELADAGDIQMEYSSDQLYSQV